MAGLIAVGVLSNQTGDVHLSTSGSALRSRKERVELCAESLIAAHKADMPVHVMRSEETVLPGIGLGIVVVDLRRLEGSQPASAHHRAHQTGLRVPDIDIAGRMFQITVPDIRIALLSRLPENQIRYLGYAPVIVGILEGLRDGLMFLFRRHHIALAVEPYAELVLARGLHHGIQEFRSILQAYSLAQGLGYHRHRIIPDHAVGLPAAELPYRQLSSFTVNGQECAQEILRPLPFDQCQQRMQGPERIPEGKYGIAVKSLSPVYLPVHSPVFPVDIGEDIGGNGGMIQCRIEGPQPLAVSSAVFPTHIYLRKIPLPQFFRRGPAGIEIKTVLRHIAQKIFTGILR